MPPLALEADDAAQERSGEKSRRRSCRKQFLVNLTEMKLGY
jgi:hypothetical protein